VLAEVSLEAHGSNARISIVQALHDGEGAVGGTVVDEDQLERPRVGVDRRDRPSVELLDRARLVEERDNDRDVRGRPFRGDRGVRPDRLGLCHTQESLEASRNHSFEGGRSALDARN
jgi:hypothetical protein